MKFHTYLPQSTDFIVPVKGNTHIYIYEANFTEICPLLHTLWATKSMILVLAMTTRILTNFELSAAIIH